jgi:NhaA family Na+:H+ antiporter
VSPSGSGSDCCPAACGTDLAFSDEALRRDAKIGVLAGSLLAAVLGSLLLRYLGDRLPLCSIEDSVDPPALPTGPWRDPAQR